MKQANQQLLRQIPSVDTVLKTFETTVSGRRFPQRIVVESIRDSIEQIRRRIVSGKAADLYKDTIQQQIIADVQLRAAAVMNPHYRRVINAAGIVLHTGLGRAVLCSEAIDRIREEMGGYSLLQIDVEEGKRSRRDQRIEDLLRILTGAEAATVVNNNAAATSIVLNTVAKGREVIVSRGQLVEIGGSFRLPDVMAFSGAKLVEVGATNKTHPRDYKNAITENTAAILRVHPSNYKIQGFSSEVGIEELAEIAHSNDLVMIDDVGAGSLIDFSKFGFAPEPTLARSIAAGADLVTASADKLIGASQGGIILGRTDLITAVRTNQFARIVRVGKLTLAVLEATLKLFLDEATALAKVPTVEMLIRPPEALTKQAKRIVAKVKKALPDAPIETVPGFSQTGSGSLPAQNMPTTLVAITPKTSAQALAASLRNYSTPIFPRIQKQTVLLDPRTLRNNDEKTITNAIIELLS